MNRPVSLKVLVIGWLFACGLGMLSCLLGFVQLIWFQVNSASSIATSPFRSTLVWFVLGNYAWTFIQTALTTLALVAAYSLWNLRSWARITLEIYSWVGLVLFGVFGAFWAYGWIGILGRFPVTLSTEILISLCSGSGVLLAIIAALIVSLCLLRGRKVREAVDRATVESLVAAI